MTTVTNAGVNDLMSKRQQFDALWSQLDNERQSFISHWRDLGDHILPRRPRFTVTDTNKGERRNQKIIDSTATLAQRTMRSGMMGGITSPARLWFRLATSDPKLGEVGHVKEWLYTVTQRMSAVFLRSNLYKVLPTIYGDLGTFGTAAFMVEEDFEKVIRCYAFAIGSYFISNNENGDVDVFAREFRMTIRQIINKFGRDFPGDDIHWERFSDTVKLMYDRKQYETWIDIRHVIEPNPEWDKTKLESKFKKYRSCYYESGFITGSAGTSQTYLKDDGDRYLSEKGYDYFPVLAPRWETTAEDTYATDCPGMTSLGDIKQLQKGEKDSAKAIELMYKPPMTGPSSMKTSKASIVPGDMTYTDEREGQKGFRPVYQVDPRIEELENKQEQVRQRIRRAFYEDLFLMLANTDRRDITAREVDEKHEEKLLALGPVLEQLNQDMLDPLIDITFNIMFEQGLFDDLETPEELQQLPLRVEYTSIMAQAQKLAGIANIERFAGFVLNIVGVTKDPTMFDKIDIDQLIDIYGDITSLPPGIIRPDDAVAVIKEQRAKMQQQQAVSANVQQGADIAKNLSQADLSNDNALSRLLKQAQAGQLVNA